MTTSPTRSCRLEPGNLLRLADLLPRVADPLARALLWNSAWDACRDAEQPADWFVGVAASALPAETEVAILDAVLERARGIAVQHYLPPPARRRRQSRPTARCSSGRTPSASGPGRWRSS